MKLRRGTLKKIEALTGIANTRVWDYMATKVRPKPLRAVELEKAAKQLGYDCPVTVWLLGSSEEIRSRFLNGKRTGLKEVPSDCGTSNEDDHLKSKDGRLEKERPAIGEEIKYLETAKKIADQIIRNEASLDILSATPSLKETVMAMIESRTKQPREEAV